MLLRTDPGIKYTGRRIFTCALTLSPIREHLIKGRDKQLGGHTAGCDPARPGLCQRQAGGWSGHHGSHGAAAETQEDRDH